MSNIVTRIIDSVADIKAADKVFEVPAIKESFLQNRSYIKNAELAEVEYTQEVNNFMSLFEANTKLNNCTPVSIANSFLQLAKSGVSLSDGQAYVIPYGKEATFQVGAQGRKQQLYMFGAKKVNTGVVYEGDEIKFDMANKKVSVHNSSGFSDVIIGAYIEVEMNNGTRYLKTKNSKEIEEIKKMSKQYKKYLTDVQTASDPESIDKPYMVAFPSEHAKNVMYRAVLKDLDNSKAKSIADEGNDEVTEDITYEDLTQHPIDDTQDINDNSIVIDPEVVQDEKADNTQTIEEITAQKMIDNCSTDQELLSLWNSNTELHNEQWYKDMFTKRKQQLTQNF